MSNIDFNKPIEYHYCRASWREAVLLDKEFNGCALLKYRERDGSWNTKAVAQQSMDKIRNVPEKKIYRVVVTRNRNTNGLYSCKVDRPYTIGETFSGQPDTVVIGYHEGEFTV